MNKLKKDIEEALNIAIAGDVTEEYILAAIEVCEEILMMDETDEDTYQLMLKLEKELHK